MIESLYIKNFKSIKNIDLNFSGLNLFFGMNGMGKSSTIQSLLLCRQSFWRNGGLNLDKLYPSGDLVDLGSTGEVFNKHADDNKLELIIEEDGKEIVLSYLYRSDIDDYGVAFAKEEGNGIIDYSGSLFSEGFVYLAAEHLGPRKRYDYSRWDLSGINKYGSHGEFTVPFLATKGTQIHVPPKMCNPKERSDSLIDQVSAWMVNISPGIRINTEMHPQEQEAKLRISYNEGRMVSDDYSPQNVGFGIPYSLPVVVAILAAKRGDLIILENPESHLHPKGQSALAKLMSCAVSEGIQIICESHSDHIINGIRVSVKEGLLDKDKVSIYYYSKDNQQETQCTPIRVDSNGNLDNYPAGLLDEWGELMARLL